jgi:hypothetical protein
LKISRHQLEIWWSQIEFTGDVITEPVNGYLWPLNRHLMPWNFQIQYSYFHSNVIMGIDLQTALPHYWQDDAKILKISHAIYFNRGTDTVTITPLNWQLIPWNFQIQYSYLHSNVIMCIDVHCHITDKMT